MKLLRLILIFPFIFVTSLSAELEQSSGKRLTFPELINNPFDYTGEKIELIGVLSVQGNEVFLCESTDACLSWTPSRVKVNADLVAEHLMGEQNRYDMCHVSIYGYFHYEENNLNYEIGFIGMGKPFFISLSIARSDYHEINPRCNLWNEYVDNRGRDESVRQETIDRMRSPSW